MQFYFKDIQFFFYKTKLLSLKGKIIDDIAIFLDIIFWVLEIRVHFWIKPEQDYYKNKRGYGVEIKTKAYLICQQIKKSFCKNRNKI